MTNATDAPLAQSLSITFSGAFFYDFAPGKDSNSVYIYAPYCPYHLAGFFYSTNSLSETDLWKSANVAGVERTYRFQGGIGSKSNQPKMIKPSFPTGLSLDEMKKGILRIPAHESLALRADKMLFKLVLPQPQYVCPLYFDQVEVVPRFDQAPDNDKISHYATALRFFYSWDASSSIELVIPGGGIFDITPPVYTGMPALGDIEVRYEGLELADENDPHSDARSCFSSLAALAGVEWWLNYGDGLSSPTNSSQGSEATASAPGAGMRGGSVSPRFHQGGDCHAAIIVNGLDLG